MFTRSPAQLREGENVSSLLQHDKSRLGGTLEDLWKNRNVVVVHTVDGQRVRLAVTSLNYVRSPSRQSRCVPYKASTVPLVGESAVALSRFAILCTSRRYVAAEALPRPPD